MTRPKRVMPSALLSLVVHAIALAMLSTLASVPGAHATPLESDDLVAVTLSGGGSVGPALAEALPSPAVVEGVRVEHPAAPRVVRRRVLAPRPPELELEVHEVASADSPDSAPEVSASIATPAAAPLAGSESSVSDPGSGIGSGGGSADGAGDADGNDATEEPRATVEAPRPTSAPADRCGDDPLDGVWVGHERDQYGEADVTLDLDRSGARVTGRVVLRRWYGAATCTGDALISSFDEAVEGEPVNGSSPWLHIWSLGCETGHCALDECHNYPDAPPAFGRSPREWYFGLRLSEADHASATMRGGPRFRLTRVRCRP